MTFLILILLLQTALASSLSFLSSPSNLSVSIYLPAQFSCFIEHNKSISVTWTHNSQTFACFSDCPTEQGYTFTIGQSGEATLSTMRIDSVELSDGGSVGCMVTQVADSATISSSATLTVNDVLDFIQPPADISRRVGDSVAFYCEVNKGGSTFVWKRQGSVLANNQRYTYATTSNSSSLTITELTAVDMGEFVCEVTLASEVIANSPATLTLVDYLAPSVLQGYLFQVNLLIGPKTVTCPVEGNPLPSDITWTRGGVPVPTSLTEGPYSVAGVLQFDTSSESHSGVYSCLASNGLDSANGTVSIEVTGFVGVLTRWYVIMGLCVSCLAITCVIGAFLLSLACCYADRRKESHLVKKYDERIRQVKTRRAERARAMMQRSEATKTSKVRPKTQPADYTNVQTSQFTHRLPNTDGSVTYSVNQERVQVGVRGAKRPNTVAETQTAPAMRERPPTHLRLPRQAN